MDPTRPHRPSPVAIVLVPLAVALVLTLFAWPNARLEPRDLPVGVAGAPAATAAARAAAHGRQGAFDVHRYPDEAAARDGHRGPGGVWRVRRDLRRARRC